MKKHTAYLFVSAVTIVCFSLSCRQDTKISTSSGRPETPIAVEGKENLFQAGQFYFGGQPDEEMLRWLTDDGVKTVINVRTLEEMDTHTNENFDEYTLANDLGMTYFHFPMGGNAGYSPQVVDTFAHTLETYKGKTFVHCKVGGRVSYLWMAYLIRHRGIPVDDAIDIGKKMKFRFPLEDLLGYSFSMRKKG